MRRFDGEVPPQDVNLLELTPVREAEWEQAEGHVVIHRSPPTGRGIKGAVDRFMYLLQARRIRLDQTASLTWLLLDGERTVEQVANRLREELGESVEPAEERLGKLLQVMHREGLVSYRELDA
jgi:hypothetical protein